MNKENKLKEVPLFEAFELIREGNIKNARLKVGLEEEEISDREFEKGMISLHKAIELMTKSQPLEAWEKFQEATPIIIEIKNEEARGYIELFFRLSEGVDKLIKGDSIGAKDSFDLAEEMMETAAFYAPEMKKSLLSVKALSYIALFHLKLDLGEFKAAESLVGKIKDLYQRLLNILDPESEDDTLFFLISYSTLLELTNVFILFDLQILNFEGIEDRLDAVREIVPKLEEVIEKAEIQDLLDAPKGILISYTILKDLQELAKIIIVNRSPIKKEGIQKFRSIGKRLFQARELFQRIGEKGKGNIVSLNRIQFLSRNLIEIAKPKKNDFGRFSGLISLGCYAILLILIQLVIHPQGLASHLYLLGGLIISLIAGFGYGALRFKPLLSMVAKGIIPLEKEE